MAGGSRIAGGCRYQTTWHVMALRLDMYSRQCVRACPRPLPFPFVSVKDERNVDWEDVPKVPSANVLAGRVVLAAEDVALGMCCLEIKRINRERIHYQEYSDATDFFCPRYKCRAQKLQTRAPA